MDPQAFEHAPLAAVLATIGFFLLAFILLYPVWRFLNREEELSKDWTPEELARRSREHHGSNGASDPEVDSAREVPSD